MQQNQYDTISHNNLFTTMIVIALSGRYHQVDSVACPPPPPKHMHTIHTCHTHTPNPQSIVLIVVCTLVLLLCHA